MSISKFFYMASMFTGLVDAYQLFVKHLVGPTIPIDVDGDTTVLEMKEMISKKQGIPVAHQRLIVLGKLLEDGTTLDDLHKEFNEVQIILVVREPAVQITDELEHLGQSIGKAGYKPDKHKAALMKLEEKVDALQESGGISPCKRDELKKKISDQQALRRGVQNQLDLEFALEVARIG